MQNDVLEYRGLRIKEKTIISILLVACSLLLPQIVHMAFGSKGGMILLPMYLPVIISGFIIGPYWGLGISLVSPLLSFLLTSGGTPMPSLELLPFMVIELTIFAFVCGCFSKKDRVVLPLLLAQICGRGVFILLSIIFQTVSFDILFNQMKLSLIGLGLQMALVPVIVFYLKRVLKHD